MKIYYTIPDNVSNIESKVDMAFKDAPEEYKQPIASIKTLINTIYNEMIFWQFETIKYKMKWAVRSIEEEIESEDGMIIINDKGGADVKGFSPLLRDKITNTIDEKFER